MANTQNPRRRPATGPVSSIDSLTDSMNAVSIDKASTFQANSKQESSFWTPFQEERAGPVRSPTCPNGLEELLIGSGERRTVELLQKVDGANTPAQLSSVLNEPEVLPVPKFMVGKTEGSPASSRRSSIDALSDYDSDSGADSLMSSPATEVSDDLENEDNSKQTGSSRVHRSLSEHARKQILDFILKPILQQQALKDYHRLIRGIPSKIVSKEIRTIRDLEKAIIFNAPDYSRSPTAYRSFCEISIRCLQLTVQSVHESDQCLPTDRPYTPHYFVDLVEQIRRYAAILAATREKQARGEPLGPNDAKPGDKLELSGGMSYSGKPAVLAVIKEEQAISLADNKPISLQPMVAKRPIVEDEDEVARSMARRKKGEPRRSYPCPHAGCTKPPFNRPCDLTKHLKTHERPFKCPEPTCKFHTLGWPTEKECERHYNDKHALNPKLYTCEHCEEGTYKTKRESNLKQHLEQYHGVVYVRSKGNGKRKASGDSNAQNTKPSPSALIDSAFNSPLPHTVLSPSVESTVSSDYAPINMPSASESPAAQQPFQFDFNFSGFDSHFNMDYIQPSPAMSVGPAYSEGMSSAATPLTAYSPYDLQMADFDHTIMKGANAYAEPSYNDTYDMFNDPNFKQLAEEVLAEGNFGPTNMGHTFQPTGDLATFSPLAGDAMISGVSDETVNMGAMNGDFQLFNSAPEAAATADPNAVYGDMLALNNMGTQFQAGHKSEQAEWNLFPELME